MSGESDDPRIDVEGKNSLIERASFMGLISSYSPDGPH